MDSGFQFGWEPIRAHLNKINHLHDFIVEVRNKPDRGCRY